MGMEAPKPCFGFKKHFFQTEVILKQIAELERQLEKEERDLIKGFASFIKHVPGDTQDIPDASLETRPPEESGEEHPGAPPGPNKTKQKRGKRRKVRGPLQ